MISFSLLLEQLKAGGWRWVFDRLRREWRMPTTPAGRAFYRARRPRRTPGPSGQVKAADALYAFYDLAVAPLTFDVLWFLTAADLERRRKGLESVNLVIVPGPEGGVRHERPDYEAVVDRDGRRARIGDIIVPAARFLPSLGGVAVAASREEAEAIAYGAKFVFPSGYEPAMPRVENAQPCLEASRREQAEIAVLRATAEGLAEADAWLARHDGGRKAVVITLRGYSYMPARNSNLKAWIAFAEKLDKKRFLPVFVPDTSQPAEDMAALAPFAVCAEAAESVDLRMALYERAYLNLGVNNGPMGLCWLNARSRDLTFKIITRSAPQTTEAAMRNHGFEIGKSLPFATPYQRWVWEDDDLDVIEREFAAMTAQIDQGA